VAEGPRWALGPSSVAPCSARAARAAAAKMWGHALPALPALPWAMRQAASPATLPLRVGSAVAPRPGAAQGFEGGTRSWALAVAAVPASALAMRQARQSRTRLAARRKKRKSSKGPKALKSGYWQEGEPDWNVNIFEWISAEDLLDEPPAELTSVREVAAYTEYPDGAVPEMYDAPEYRAPSMPLQLQKGLRPPPVVDQGLDRDFIEDLRDVVEYEPEAMQVLKDADVVTSLASLRMLLHFVDGTMTEDFRAKGMNTRRRSEAEQVDLMRLSRMAEAPKAIVMPCVWDWVPENMTINTGQLNQRSYTVGFQRAATGKGQPSGPPSVRNAQQPVHFRLLEYKVGDIKMVVRVPLSAQISSIDAEDLEGEGKVVDLESTNRRDTGDLWSRALDSRYATMKLADTAMVVEGIVDKGVLLEIRETTRQDLRLDRPSVEDEAAGLLGKLAGVIKRVHEVMASPGCQDKPMYLQFCDAELRIISPRFDDDDDYDSDEDEDGEAGGPPDGDGGPQVKEMLVG